MDQETYEQHIDELCKTSTKKPLYIRGIPIPVWDLLGADSKMGGMSASSTIRSLIVDYVKKSPQCRALMEVRVDERPTQKSNGAGRGS